MIFFKLRELVIVVLDIMIARLLSPLASTRHVFVYQAQFNKVRITRQTRTLTRKVSKKNLFKSKKSSQTGLDLNQNFGIEDGFADMCTLH